MHAAKSIRTTVSVPEELYAALEKAAESSHVSTAWVIRDALRLYLGKQGKAMAVVGGAKKSGRKAKSR